MDRPLDGRLDMDLCGVLSSFFGFGVVWLGDFDELGMGGRDKGGGKGLSRNSFSHSLW